VSGFFIFCRKIKGLHWRNKRMHFNFSQEWPVFVLIGVFLWFVLYVAISGRKNKEKDQSSPKK